MVPILSRGASGPAVRKYQRSLKRRLRPRDPEAAAAFAVDGEFGPATEAAEHRAADLLGLLHPYGSVARALRRQNLIRHPGRRTRAEVKEGVRRARAALNATAGPRAAIKWAQAQVGTREATGRNDGAKIHAWQRWAANGASYLDGAPYCGIGAVNACVRHAGVKAYAPERWAAVAYIEDDARASRNGFSSWSGREHTGRPGDLVVLFGRGVHVELIVERVPGGYRTVGFNTSPGDAGSQANGGGVFARVRYDGSVHGIAHVNYS